MKKKTENELISSDDVREERSNFQLYSTPLRTFFLLPSQRLTLLSIPRAYLNPSVQYYCNVQGVSGGPSIKPSWCREIQVSQLILVFSSQDSSVEFLQRPGVQPSERCPSESGGPITGPLKPPYIYVTAY